MIVGQNLGLKYFYKRKFEVFMVLGLLMILIIGFVCFESWPSNQQKRAATTCNEDSDVYFDYFIIDEMID